MIASSLQVVFVHLMRLVQVLLGFAGWAGAALILGLHLGFDLQPFSSMILASGLGVIALVVHEGGHYLGARLYQMPVLMMRVAAVEVQVRRRNWQIRWSPQPKGRRFGGYVMAVPNLQFPLRQQMLWYVLMGPLANLVTALVSGGFAWLIGGEVSAVFLAFAVLNLGMALGNLVPTSHISPSDGLLLIAWYLQRDDQLTELAPVRLKALSLAGVACEQLPETDIAHLARGAMPSPLLAISYRLGALLNQGDFQAVARLEEDFKAVLQEHVGSLEDSGALITRLRIEFAFVHAFLERDANHLWKDWANTDLDWLYPWLRPRCEALRACLQGDMILAERFLQQALTAASNSVIPATSRSEQLLASSMRALPVALRSKDL